MSKLSIAVVGAMGYGHHLVKEAANNADRHDTELRAIVDVSPNASIVHAAIKDKGVKFFTSLADMYKAMSIDLVVIASPIQYHSNQACEAMMNGSHVLLEKPIAGSLQDANDIMITRDKTGKKLLIGYQQCYDDTIRCIKEIILSGELGTLQRMKSIVLWPRSATYYNRNNWAGKKYDAHGRAIYDSVTNNATAHYYICT